MTYRETITKIMTTLGEREDSIFLGQSICYPGNVMYGTLKGVPDEKKIEMPVAEDMQLGISIGLALQGYLPISMFPRMDFMMRCMDQLINHLDKIEEMSCGQFNPKIIIRTMVGSIQPLDPGCQHKQSHEQMMSKALKHITTWTARTSANCSLVYKYAVQDGGMVVEYGDSYND